MTSKNFIPFRIKLKFETKLQTQSHTKNLIQYMGLIALLDGLQKKRHKQKKLAQHFI